MYFLFLFYEMECPQQGSNLKVHPYPFVLNIGRFTFDSSYRSNNVGEATRIRNAIKRFEQTKVANEDSASKMLGGTRMQRIIVSVIHNSLSAVSQLLTRSSQISAITPQIESSFHNSQFEIHSSQFSIFSIHNSPQSTLNSELPIPNSQL